MLRRPQYLFTSDTKIVAGVDESGRGPVLGSMVITCFYMPAGDEELLRTMGVTDSKKLSAAKRDELYDLFNNSDKMNIGYDSIVLDAEELSAASLSQVHRQSLNDLSYCSTVALVRRIMEGLNLDMQTLYVDAVGSTEHYGRRLRAALPTVGDITVAEKADAIYPVVGAASICAKVIRDRTLEMFSDAVLDRYNELPRGCGYPGDLITRQFLKESLDIFFGFPSIVRHSWTTARDMMDTNAVAIEWRDDNSDETEKPSKDSTFLSKSFISNKCRLW